MKKLLTLLSVTLLLLAAMPSHAQLTKAVTPTQTSLSGADTAIAVLPVSNIVTAVEIGATKSSGTVGGKVYFQGLNLHSTEWTNLDSMTVANSAGLQYKRIAMTSPFPYAAYRFYYLSTGGIWAPTAYYLRRN